MYIYIYIYIHIYRCIFILRYKYTIIQEVVSRLCQALLPYADVVTYADIS